MTIAPDHHEPFDAEPFSDEERDLAARLGRVGLDGPSPALDMKILAAAHAASVPRRAGKRRRFAWLGVPPALVTGVGVAAAAVLVLGVVWQLRPQYGAMTAQSEADAGEEIILIAPPSDAPAPTAAGPAAVPERVTLPAPAAPARPSATPPAAARADSVAEPVPQAAASAPAPASTADDVQSPAPAAAPEMYSRTTDAAADASSSDHDVVVTPPHTGYRNATYTTAARAAAERRERSATPKAAAVASETAAASEEGGTTLDRVQVTGSRIRGNPDVPDVDWAEVPVSDDTHLESIEWLERIRARRDEGDKDNARASLELFQREYPRVRLPEDLRALADTKQ